MKEKIMKTFNNVKRVIITNKSLSLKILSALIVIIAIIVIASCFNKAKFGNSIGNNNNLGLAAQSGKWIYYVDIDDDKPVGICRAKNNGKKTEKVAEGPYYELNIIDGYIYCIEQDEDDSQINLVKIKTNGKKKETLARDIDNRVITVTKKWVFYYKNNNLYKVKLDGTDRSKIADKKISYYCIDGNWIYYIYSKEDNQYIAKMKLDGEKNVRLAKADEANYYETLYVKGGKIYYVFTKTEENYNQTYYLGKMNKDGKKSEQVFKIDTNVQYINMNEDGIYYTTTENYDDYSIKFVKYNGTDKKTIKKTTEVSNINLIDDWIIYLSEDDDYNMTLKMIKSDGKKEKDI